jgi:serine/threonine-protein kinase
MAGDRQPKIVDFGIARVPQRVSDQPAHADKPYTLFHNNLLGTPNYMSPEQALGRDVDERTDIYSLGAVMYEMLVGRKPFHSSRTDQLLQQIAYKAPPAPHEINPEVPMVLSQIVVKAMSKRPEKRYQTAADMALDLKRYVSRERRARQRRERSGTAENTAAPGHTGSRFGPLFWILCALLSGAIALGYLLRLL